LKLEPLEDRRLLSIDWVRSIDGAGNNEVNESWGAANTPLLRLTQVEYGEGLDGAFPAMDPDKDINPRIISNLVFDQDEEILNDRSLTSFVFQWGQFLDHDMDLTEDFPPAGTFEELLDGENISFPVPQPDEELPAVGFVPMLRSRFEWIPDDAGNNVAQQINQITAYIDASNVYGSDDEKAEGLRAHRGGLLLTSDGDINVDDGTGSFLPLNVDGLENASPPATGTGVPIHPDDLFVAGDVRSNEQPGLASLHTLFVREHNYQARQIAQSYFPGASLDRLTGPRDEWIYQRARAIVGAEVQAITYNEFLPALFGPNQLESYRGYDSNVNPSIANVFAHAIYRVGHTMLPNELMLLKSDGQPVDDAVLLGATVSNGEVALDEAFFNPALISHYGIEPYLKGLAVQNIQEIDHLIIDGVRNLLFDPPAGTDLGATNLQRGRDHGLADYNQVRVDFGLDPVSDFSHFPAEVGTKLSDAYEGDLSKIDVFAGAISERHLAGSSVGELVHAVLVDQFTRLRDGDRFYYENVFGGSALNKIRNTQLSDIIRRNTGLQNIQDEVFRDERSAFVYRATEGRGSLDATLRVRGRELQLVENRPNRVLASRPLSRASDLDVVVLFGTSQADEITIDPSVQALSGVAIELHGGAGTDSLIVRGSSSNDKIIVGPSYLKFNDLDMFYGNFESVDVRAGRGDDQASVEGLVVATLILDGGFGDDELIGGPGSQILVGGPGNDSLTGKAGRDLLIGGAGVDTIRGNRGQDILIGGSLLIGRDSLSSILKVWKSELSYFSRVDTLETVLRGNVLDDRAVDVLIGGRASDWFLADASDELRDRRRGESVSLF
jgi:hypothetical protein